MGEGIILECACGKIYDISLGTGFRFTDVYADALSKAREGVYGEQWKKITNENKYTAIDAEKKLYYCPKCHYWEIEYGLDLYLPNNVEALKKQQYGIKTVEEWGYVPYVMSYQLSACYSLRAVYHHICPECKVDMQCVDDLDHIPVRWLKCKECGGELQEKEIYKWD